MPGTQAVQTDASGNPVHPLESTYDYTCKQGYKWVSHDYTLSNYNMRKVLHKVNAPIYLKLYSFLTEANFF